MAAGPEYRAMLEQLLEVVAWLQAHPRPGIRLRQVSARFDYPALLAAFEAHSLLLFRGQQLDDEAHLAFGGGVWSK